MAQVRIGVMDSVEELSLDALEEVRDRHENTFVPSEPRDWDGLGVDAGRVERLVLRFLLAAPKVSGKQIAKAIGLALPLVQEITNEMKTEKLVNYVGTNVLGDFICELTHAGQQKAVASRKDTTYVGKVPVPWEQYLASVRAQGLLEVNPGPGDLRRAFADLSVNDELLEGLGPAINSAQPLFLHGEPGNGKTSLAERITACFGDSIWLPYTLDIGGVLVKLFDPALHHPVAGEEERADRRWVRIRRPTVVAGGELTLAMLEVVHDDGANVAEAPLQLKASCGTLVIDDFGRGRTSPQDLLNRWIFPLEKRVDFLQMPDGRKVACPFECMLVFSTNLEPRDLADEAFLRRIPYKVYVGDPDEHEFAELVATLATRMGVQLPRGSVKYLIERHFKMAERPMRFCHPRDLLQQVVDLARYRNGPAVAGPAEWDRVVRNYFGLA